MEFRPMSPEEIERTMQFVLQQQAQFAADVVRVEANLASVSAKTDRIADGVVHLVGVMGMLAGETKETERQVRETDAHLRETDARLRETDTRVRRLTETFDRHLREDHGRAPSEG